LPERQRIELLRFTPNQRGRLCRRAQSDQELDASDYCRVLIARAAVARAGDLDMNHADHVRRYIDLPGSQERDHPTEW
jgi:hypothetical protein